MNYQTGQSVIYRNKGVYIIESIGKVAFLPDSEKTYYTLRPVFRSGDEHIYVPTDKEDALRQSLSAQEAGAISEKTEPDGSPPLSFHQNSTYHCALSGTALFLQDRKSPAAVKRNSRKRTSPDPFRKKTWYHRQGFPEQSRVPALRGICRRPAGITGKRAKTAGGSTRYTKQLRSNIKI